MEFPFNSQICTLFVGEVREGPIITPIIAPIIAPVILGEAYHRCGLLLDCQLSSESREEWIVGRVHVIVIQLWRCRTGGFLGLQLISLCLSSEVCANISHVLWSVLSWLGLRLVVERRDVDGRVAGQLRVVNCEGRVRAGAGIESDRQLV